jgi:hypothetical protein
MSLDVKIYSVSLRRLGTQYKEEVTHGLPVYYFYGRDAAIIAVLAG